MSQLYVDNIRNRNGGAIGAPEGVVVTGVTTSTTFEGSLNSSNLTGSLPALDGSALTNLNIPSSFTELDAALFN